MRSVEKYRFCTESEKNTQPVARVREKIPSALRVKGAHKICFASISLKLLLWASACFLWRSDKNNVLFNYHQKCSLNL